MLGDTIYAVSSPPGRSARGVVRLSGPDAVPAAARLLRDRDLPRRRATIETTLTWSISELPSESELEVDALVLVMPGPASYTGEDVVELHLPGGPLLLETLGAQLVARGLRHATPGEFSRRAFTNGRLSLDAAEGVLALIHATDQRDRGAAALLLTGGLGRGVEGVRSELTDALATIEVGLDFETMETGAVDAARWQRPIERAATAIDELLAGLPRSESGVEGGDLLLFGPVNAGKSSLCNALRAADDGGALVASTARTTRDVTAHPLGQGVRLLDAPGGAVASSEASARGSQARELVRDAGTDAIDRAALDHRDRLAAAAGGVVVVVPGELPAAEQLAWLRAATRLGPPVVALVRTKIDATPPEPLGDAAVAVHDVSNTTGAGLAELRAALLRRCAQGAGGGHGQHSAACLRRAGAHVAAARAEAQGNGLEELVAAELRAAADALDAVAGRTDAEDVLDRVFGGFCLGK